MKILYLTLGTHIYYSITMTHLSHGTTVCLLYLALDENTGQTSQNNKEVGVPGPLFYRKRTGKTDVETGTT